MATTPTKKINITTYFENLTIKLYVFLYSYYACQISCQSDIIYYMTYKLIFFVQF